MAESEEQKKTFEADDGKDVLLNMTVIPVGSSGVGKSGFISAVRHLTDDKKQIVHNQTTHIIIVRCAFLVHLLQTWK